MNFERYLIPDIPSSSGNGFLASLSRASEGYIVEANYNPFGYTMVDYQLVAIEAMIEVESADLLLMNFAAMEATGDGIDSASVEVVDKAKAAYAHLKSAKNSAEKARAAAELDAAAKEMVVESNKAKDPGSKERWKKVAKIVGGIAASVALLVGAKAIYKNISMKNANANPIQASAAVKSATNAAKQNNQQLQQSQQPQPPVVSQANSQNSSQQSQKAGPVNQPQTSTPASSGGKLTPDQVREIQETQRKADELKKKYRNLAKTAMQNGETIEGTELQRQIADLANQRDDLLKALAKKYPGAKISR